MPDDVPWRCACGEAAPAGLPAWGERPAPCGRCATPLVRPGPAPPGTVERALAAAAAAAVAAAAGRLAAARASGDGAVWAIPVTAALVALAARWAARVRTTAVTSAAYGALAAGLVLAEAVIYRYALRGRLVAMHAAEGATEPERLGDEEWRAMDFGKFLHLEVDLAWCAAVAAAVWIAWRVSRPRPAVVAFAGPPRAAPEAERPPSGEGPAAG